MCGVTYQESQKELVRDRELAWLVARLKEVVIETRQQR